MNVQVLTEPFGRLLRASPARPGSTHDPTAAPEHGIIEALTDTGLGCWADKAYQGAGGTVQVPFRGRRPKKWKRRHNTTHAKIRCLGQQAMTTLKSRHLLRKLRYSTNHLTNVVKAVLVLHHASARGWKRLTSVRHYSGPTGIHPAGPPSLRKINTRHPNYQHVLARLKIPK